jgi:hypothetical protein
MQQRKKIYGLLALWFVMAAAVVLVWLLREQKKVATVYLLPVDGELMDRNWESFHGLVDSLQPFGLLLEPDTLGQQPEFGRLIGPDLSARIKTAYSKIYNPITPDSLFQKAFATSIRKSVDKLDETNYQRLIHWENTTPRIRTMALLSAHGTRDSILIAHHEGRKAILGAQFERIPNRYAGLLMRNIGTLVMNHPDKCWIILIDIEKYNWLKARLVKDQRIEVIDEVAF